MFGMRSIKCRGNLRCESSVATVAVVCTVLIPLHLSFCCFILCFDDFISFSQEQNYMTQSSVGGDLLGFLTASRNMDTAKQFLGNPVAQCVLIVTLGNLNGSDCVILKGPMVGFA